MKKSFPKTLVLALAAAAMVGFAGTPVQASLIGDTVTGSVLFGGAVAQGPANAVVGAGVEFDFGNVDIDVRDSGALYNMIPGGGVVLDETYLLSDLDWVGIPGTLTAVNLLGFAGLSVNPVLAFTADSVSVTLPGGTNVAGGAFIDVEFVASHVVIPLPAALPLLISGILGLCFVGARRAKNPQA